MNNLKKIARLIEKELSYTNGWKIPDEEYTAKCHIIASKIVSQLEPLVMPNEVVAGGSKRWKPKEKEIFYYVNFYTGVTEQVYTNSKIHTPRNLYKIGNCYKTKEEAQIKWDQIKRILIQR